MKFTLKEITIIGIFAALTAVCAQVSIRVPFLPVPFTLQIFSVCLSAAILGSKCGAVSQIVYVLLGICGIPVFSNFHSGLNYVMGNTGGYIISFPIVAFVIGFIIQNFSKLTRIKMFLAMLVGLSICYVFGTVWLGTVLQLTPVKAIILGVGWFLPFDIIKIIIAAFIGFEVRNALFRANLLPAA